MPNAKNKVPIPTVPPKYHPILTTEISKVALTTAVVRATLEISVVSIGWYLGGTVGIGTLFFAFGIGPCVALGLYLVDKTFD